MFYISYSLILTLVTCIILVFTNKMIEEYYSKITFILNWVILDILFLITSTTSWNYLILTLYLVTVFIMTKIGDNSKSFIYGVLIALFQSEYWELSIHLYWGEIFISTFVLFSCIIYTMYLLKLEYRTFIKYTFLFSIPYFILVSIIYPLQIFRSNYLVSDFFFRIICSIYFVLFIYFSNKTYIINSSIITGNIHESQ